MHTLKTSRFPPWSLRRTALNIAELWDGRGALIFGIGREQAACFAVYTVANGFRRVRNAGAWCFGHWSLDEKGAIHQDGTE